MFFVFIINKGWAFQKHSAHRGYHSGFSCAFKRSCALQFFLFFKYSAANEEFFLFLKVGRFILTGTVVSSMHLVLFIYLFIASSQPVCSENRLVKMSKISHKGKQTNLHVELKPDLGPWTDSCWNVVLHRPLKALFFKKKSVFFFLNLTCLN